MTPPNPLVAGAVDTSTPFSGALLLEDGEQLVTAIKNGDWIAGGLAAFSAIADTVAAVMDPFGQLIAAGLGWLMDHLEPLKGWLNDLTGDAGEVQGFAATWGNVSQYLSQTGTELASRLADVEDMRGEAIAAYRRLQSDVAAHVSAAADWAGGMKVGMEIASMIVQIVHDLVRDTISQVVGALISYASQLALSLGLATPWVVAQASSRVASMTARVTGTINKLVDAISKLGKHLDELKALFSKLADLFRKGGHGGGKTPDTQPHSAGATPQSGGTNRPRDRLSPEDDRWAEAEYENIRASNTDVADIAKHPENLRLPDGSQLSADDIARIKHHLFEKEHVLTDYETGGTRLGRFDANGDQVEAWHRLQNGTARDTDRVFLMHELAESRYLDSHPGASYREAHQHANTYANWEKMIYG